MGETALQPQFSMESVVKALRFVHSGDDTDEEKRRKKQVVLDRAGVNATQVRTFLSAQQPTPESRPSSAITSIEPGAMVQFFQELPEQALGGIRDAAQEFINDMRDFGESSVLTTTVGSFRPPDLGEGPTLPEVPEAKTTGAALVRGFIQFASGFIPSKAAFKGIGATKKLANNVLAGALTDAAAFDPLEVRLSNLIQDIPAFRNFITEFLAAKPGDTRTEGRIKNVLEGMGLGAMFDLFMRPLRAIRSARRLRTTVDVKAAESTPKVETAGVSRPFPNAPGAIPPSQVVPELGAVGGQPQARPEFAGNINLDNLNSVEEVKNALKVTADLEGGFQDARRGVRTNEATKEAAAILGMDDAVLLKRRKGQAFSAEEAFQARTLLVQSGNRLIDLAKTTRGGSDADLVAFQEAFTRHVAIQEQVAGITAEAGRALQQFRIAAGELGGLRDIIETSGGRDRMDFIADRIADMDDPVALNRFSRVAFQSNIIDKVSGTLR